MKGIRVTEVFPCLERKKGPVIKEIYYRELNKRTGLPLLVITETKKEGRFYVKSYTSLIKYILKILYY